MRSKCIATAETYQTCFGIPAQFKRHVVVCNTAPPLTDCLSIRLPTAVHCTHGFNRTGFLIACYLIEKVDMSPRGAVEDFARNRPDGIYKYRCLHRLTTCRCAALPCVCVRCALVDLQCTLV